MKFPFRLGTSLVLNLLVAIPLCARPAEGDDAANDEEVIQEFNVSKNGDFLVVPVSIAGKQFGFVLDSGCAASFFDDSLRDYVGRFLGRQKISTINGAELTVGICECPAGSVTKLPLPEGSPVGLADLASLRRDTRQKIYGVLGMDFLSKCVLRVDFDLGKVTFLKRTGEDLGQEIPLSMSGSDQWKMPYVEVLISDWKSERFQVDTGCAQNGLVRQELFSVLAEQGGMRSLRRVPYTDLSGEIGIRPAARLDKIMIGEFEEHGLFFERASSNVFGRNVLGLGFLSRFIVTFDFPNEKMYLKKGEKFGSPDQVLLASYQESSRDDQPRLMRMRNRALRRWR